MSSIFYFGCWCRSGHFLFEPGEGSPRRAGRNHELSLPWRIWHDDPRGTEVPPLDGALCVNGDREGVAHVHHKDGWSALAFWDRSVDHRPGSNSVFLVESPNLSFDELVTAAQAAFPEIWRRFTWQVVEADEA